ncbi:nucleoporin NUP42 [Eublepharis macularius]|uniref:Nucleoporin NUP42 n=1 Tax=Eublepharis macularius TaxID=481883 RepID=A0AA97K100_EUBMA|nr:nucleoporin NUP42 [Eublepharis macularius]
MAGRICHYYMNGNCRYGERCWNRHPGYAEGTGQSSSQSSGSSRRGGWGSHNQRDPIVQASSFSKPLNWRSNRDHGKAFHGSQADLGFSQNRFTALNSSEDVSSDGIKNDDEKLLDIIMKDMEFWESSGQWMFSSYSPSKDNPNISGFPAFSPEELRLEYYNCSANNNIQNYVNSVQQLIAQWRSRLLELKNINASTKASLISELKNVTNQAPPAVGFEGQQLSVFGTSTFPVNKQSSAKTFSFKSPSELANVSSGSLPAFGSLTGVPNHPTLAATSSSTTTPTTHSVGFGNQTASSAASFSFKSTATPVGFGTSGFSGFRPSLPASSSDNTSAPVFGVSNIPPPLDSRNTLFGQQTNVFGSSGAASSVTQTNIVSEKLFTPKAELSADELKQFEATKFTLGKIPLKPPPMELLNV